MAWYWWVLAYWSVGMLASSICLCIFAKDEEELEFHQIGFLAGILMLWPLGALVMLHIVLWHLVLFTKQKWKSREGQRAVNRIRRSV